MIKRWIVIFALMLPMGLVKAELPELIDIKFAGSTEDAYVEPSHISLMQGKSYLLVLENPYEIPYHFDAPTLNTAITTQYIQGSSSVSQRSILISGESKVQWLLTADKPGKYPISAVLGQGHNGHTKQPAVIEILTTQPTVDADKSKDEEKTSSFTVPEGGYKAALKSDQVNYEPKPKRIMPKQAKPIRGRPN